MTPIKGTAFKGKLIFQPSIVRGYSFVFGGVFDDFLGFIKLGQTHSFSPHIGTSFLQGFQIVLRMKMCWSYGWPPRTFLRETNPPKAGAFGGVALTDSATPKASTRNFLLVRLLERIFSSQRLVNEIDKNNRVWKYLQTDLQNQYIPNKTTYFLIMFWPFEDLQKKHKKVQRDLHKNQQAIYKIFTKPNNIVI